jgi:O-antigen ligase
VAVAGIAFALAAPNALRVNLRSANSVNRSASGRLDLLRGGLRMFTDRPLFGFGSGAFAKKFRERERTGSSQAASASHTSPITVAAEQGVPGLAAYAAVLAASFGLLFGGLGGLRGRAPPPRLVTRAFLAAAYTALVVHTLLYAAFLEDPITWTLLAAGIVLGRPDPGAETAATASASRLSSTS